MDTKLIVVRIALVISGGIFIYKGCHLSPAQIEQTIFAPWTKEIVLLAGASLVGLGMFLPEKA